MFSRVIKGLAKFIALIGIISLGMIVQTAYAGPTIHLEEAKLLTGGVWIETDGMLVNPTPDTTPDDAVLLNKNVFPLREVPVLVFADDGTKTTISVNYSISGDLSTPRATTRGLVLSGGPNPITFGDWCMAKATGTVKVKVKGEKNTSKVVLHFSGLIPNTLYTVWQINNGIGGADGPFGGIPSAFVSDEDGNAKFTRDLPFDAIEVIDFLDVVYHSDHNVYGGIPSPMSGGIIHHGQLRIDFPGY